MIPWQKFTHSTTKYVQKNSQPIVRIDKHQLRRVSTRKYIKSLNDKKNVKSVDCFDLTPNLNHSTISQNKLHCWTRKQFTRESMCLLLILFWMKYIKPFTTTKYVYEIFGEKLTRSLILFDANSVSRLYDCFLFLTRVKITKTQKQQH